ncbi:SRPBCC family protein [Rossellomorea sp. y25]|uniref:SRPBCC family protein n=1 Tax=Rossellomorea sp. y25 TaxID=3118174 RepID=UPI0030DDF471
MVDVLTEITIRCPLHKVSEYASDPENAPEWYVNIDSAEWLTDKPLSIDSQVAFKAKFLGKELSYVYEITEFIPGEKLVMKTANGPFPMETTYTWEALDEQVTRMTLRNQGKPTGFSKWVAPFMSTMMKKANKKDLKRIKDILES